MNKLSLATDTFKSESDRSSSPECVLLVAAKRPFYADRTLAELPTLGSIADMLCAIGLDPIVPARVFLDDRIVLAQEGSGVFLKPGQLLTVRVVPEGGGRGKDTELLTIAVAAVAAIATWGAGAALSAGWVAAGVGTTATTAGTTAAGAAAAITQTSLPICATALDTAIAGAVSESVKFLGGLAINALIPPPAVRLDSSPQSFTVSGGANAAAAFSVIPKIYGKRRIFPQYAASPYSELVGFDQYLRMLFLLGYGPLDISQIQLGDTALEDYEDVEWELRSGFTDDAPSRLYPGSVSESDINIQLSKSNVGSAPTVYGWSNTQTSGPLADEFELPTGATACGCPKEIRGLRTDLITRQYSSPDQLFLRLQLGCPGAACGLIVRIRFIARRRQRCGKRPQARNPLPKRWVVTRSISIASALVRKEAVIHLFLRQGRTSRNGHQRKNDCRCLQAEHNE